jgi:hypothetical protein
MRGNGIGWDIIAAKLNRTIDGCVQRYYYVIKKTSWNFSERNSLLDLTVKFGEDWDLIANFLNTNADVCGLIILHALIQ